MHWRWHEKEYLGACHGAVGILYTLYLFKNHEIPYDLNARFRYFGPDSLRNTLHEILDAHILRSGNLKSSVGSHKDELVQWCHGAVGIVYLMCAYIRSIGSTEQVEIERCLSIIENASNCIWERGLLIKGMFPMCI